MARKDSLHEGYRPICLGLPVYCGSTPEGSAWWQDMSHAFAIVMQNHDPELFKHRIGASTGIVHLSRLALKWMPEPWASEIQHEYRKLAAKRRAADEIDAQAAANT